MAVRETVHHVGKQRAIAGFAPAQLSLGNLSLGDVEDDSAVADNPPLPVTSSLGPRHQPALRRTRQVHPPLGVHLPPIPVGEGHAKRGFCRFAVVGMNRMAPRLVRGFPRVPVETVKCPDLVGPGAPVGRHVPVPNAGPHRVEGVSQFELLLAKRALRPVPPGDVARNPV